MTVNSSNITGMIGGTYFINAPVILKWTGLQFPDDSSINVAVMQILYNDKKVGEFRSDMGGATEVAIDISSALRPIWADYNFAAEVEAAEKAATGQEATVQRPFRQYYIRCFTEYIQTSTFGEKIFTQSAPFTFYGGQCVIGATTELERFLGTAGEGSIDGMGTDKVEGSTKPVNEYPVEQVGTDSITSIIYLQNDRTIQRFLPKGNENTPQHIIRPKTHSYFDFIFLNRRGCIETATAITMESGTVEGETTTYEHDTLPAFIPARSVTNVPSATRRALRMSSGQVDREWARWWATEFCQSKAAWIRIKNRFVPVTITHEKSIPIYDRSKQELPHVDFTVTLALDG